VIRRDIDQPDSWVFLSFLPKKYLVFNESLDIFNELVRLHIEIDEIIAVCDSEFHRLFKIYSNKV